MFTYFLSKAHYFFFTARYAQKILLVWGQGFVATKGSYIGIKSYPHLLRAFSTNFLLDPA
ncbi:hypothetical protein SY88_09755 [Clostridiales bacterium PH28_bin88]|nr:hypothetical protein SY88_09755 [Clostridiales bacterium PH28_bin88]